MAQALPFADSLLFVGLLSPNLGRFRDAAFALEGIFGPLSYESEALPFIWTEYYEKELGKNLMRSFLAFSHPFAPSALAWAKARCNELEDEFAGPDGKRTVDIDPGLISGSNLILASCKPAPQRIALADGIYAETTLIRSKGLWIALPWTYPDFRSPAYAAILDDILASRGSVLKR